jgi:hypothetical protein
MALRNQPYLPLYINDFLTDEKLIECSASATGVYIRLMCLMHKSEDYGKILLKQKDKQNVKHLLNFASKLARQMPYSEKVILEGLTELIDEGVLHIEGDVLFQKRMVHDNSVSIQRSISGKKGGEFAQAKIKANAQKVALAKIKANTENENEYINENINGITKGGVGGFLEREKKFIEEVKSFNPPGNIFENFISYWTEPNKSKTKMRWELQQTFDIKRRIETFKRNNREFSKPEKDRSYQVGENLSLK